MRLAQERPYILLLLLRCIVPVRVAHRGVLRPPRALRQIPWIYRYAAALVRRLVILSKRQVLAPALLPRVSLLFRVGIRVPAIRDRSINRRHVYTISINRRHVYTNQTASNTYSAG